MDVTELDPDDLRMSMLLAMDFIVAHRVARDHSYDFGRITAARDTLEQRVVHALAETDPKHMPEGWSWRHAAHEISILVVLDMVDEERAGP